MILINLGGELINMKPIMDAIKQSEPFVVLPNNSWVVCTEENLSWWNNFIFDTIKQKHLSIEKRGNINLAYYLCYANDLCGTLDKEVCTKIKSVREKIKPSNEAVPIIQNILDRMEI